ncbi:MAG: NUDIX domain-containing protein [Alphaproteobacteria bacterium]|nr:NUDIX domain-containing protein [Alphaproteobacteria bacterium]
MTERFKCPMAAHLFLKKDDKILFQLRSAKSYNGFWGVVAGHLDGKETASQACIREAKEEIGIDINKEDLKLATICHSYVNNVEYLQFFFYCEQWNGEIKNMELDKCSDLQWLDLNNLPNNTVPYILKAIKNTENKEFFYEDGF